MLRRYRNNLEKIEKELVIKKSLKVELAEVKEANESLKTKVNDLKMEMKSLKKEVKSEKKKNKDWEEGFNEEHACIKRWEEAAKSLQEKYEDGEGNINKEIYDFCVGAFLDSQEFKNLYMRPNYVAIKESIVEAHQYVLEKLPKYDRAYQAYVNPDISRSYVLPWEEGFDLPNT